MTSIKLELKDCLEDSPQTRALIGVFQQDAEALTNYARGLQYAFQRITYAQSELTAATQDLAQHLREFDNQKFTLTTDNDYISSTMQQLASKVDQIASFNAVLQTQLAENSAYNSARFVEKYLMEFHKLKAKFQASDKAHQEAMKKMSKLSKKRTNDSSWQEATDQLHAARKGFNEASMNFCSCLNLLQGRKKTGLLDPLISYIYAQMGFFKMGGELCQKELDEYVGQLMQSLQDLEKDIFSTEKENNLLIDRIDAESTRAYIPDPPPSMDFPELPVDTRLTQISGYLFARSPGVFMNQWNQRYYFTQGGNLMQQGRDEVAGGLVMDLDGSTTTLVDTDDRRYVFQVTAQDGKQSVTLQAEGKHACAQWVATLNNISKGLYLANDPSKAAELMQAASEPTGSASGISNNAQPAKPDQKPAKQEQVKGERSTSQSSSDFETKHEAFRPSGVFERIKNAATSLMAPSKDAEKGGRHPSGEGDAVSHDTTDSELEAVVNSSSPILFDLPSPAGQGVRQAPQEISPAHQPAVAKEQEQPTQEVATDLPSPQRENPFTAENTSSGVANLSLSDVNQDSESSFRAMYVVRFLGCKQVDSELHSGYQTISDSIRAVMAARALHNIFSMNELHFVVTNSHIQLVDPGTQLCRDTFPIKNILQAANHRENPRLFGFIARTATPSGPDVNMCYAFESNSDGGDICCAIATAQVMVQSLIEHDEIERQRELESDLEEQSKLFSQSQSDDVINNDVTPTEEAPKFEEEDLTMKDT